MNDMHSELLDSQDLENLEIEEKSEEEFIDDMKANIHATLLRVSNKVNKSALNFMLKQKKWIPQENATEAEKFFLEKIPKVLTEEAAKELNSVLGL